VCHWRRLYQECTSIHINTAQSQSHLLFCSHPLLQPNRPPELGPANQVPRETPWHGSNASELSSFFCPLQLLRRRRHEARIWRGAPGLAGLVSRRRRFAVCDTDDFSPCCLVIPSELALKLASYHFLSYVRLLAFFN
jgi:hypothetical protein